MAEITITITADEDDLRGFAFHKYAVERVADAIAAALPKPRIVVRPGMVLRHKHSGERYAIELFDNCTPRRMQLRCLTVAKAWAVFTDTNGLDPDEWEVLLDAEDGAT